MARMTCTQIHKETKRASLLKLCSHPEALVAAGIRHHDASFTDPLDPVNIEKSRFRMLYRSLCRLRRHFGIFDG